MHADLALGERWVCAPLPSTLSQLDLLLLTVRKTRRVQQDGIRFEGYRYIDTTLAGYVREDVLIRCLLMETLAHFGDQPPANGDQRSGRKSTRKTGFGII